MLSPAYILNILKTECGYSDGDSVLVGVSGGADSMALLHLLHAAKIPVAAAHVNYGLRGDESEGDEQFVAELCAQLKVPLYVRKSARAELDAVANNLQNAARIVRYGFFKEIIEREAMRFIAIAHHQDDQLETILMNFLRGSGFRGLAGMTMLDEASEIIIRPLLNHSRKTIEEYLNANHQLWRTDSSNFTDQYLRNRMRAEVIPALHAIDERESKGWNRSVQLMMDSNALLYVFASPFIEYIMTKHGMIGKIDKQKVLAFAQPHLLFNCILNLRGFQLQFTRKEFTEFTALQTGKKFFSGNMQLTVDREEWIIAEHSSATRTGFIIAPGEEKFGWQCNEIAVDNPANYSGFEAVLATSDPRPVIGVRVWKKGDCMQPFGFNGTKKVSDILTEIKVPSDEKANYPLLTINEEVAWIPGYRIAEKYKVTDTTKTALHIKWNR